CGPAPGVARCCAHTEAGGDNLARCVNLLTSRLWRGECKVAALRENSGRKRDVMGLGLAALSRLAGSRTLERTGLREPVQNLVSAATRNGFKVAGAAGRTFSSSRKRGGEATRPAPAEDKGLFDLTPSE